MTRLRPGTKAHEDLREALVWIDHDHAVIAGRGIDDQGITAHVDRSPTESQPSFNLRTIREIVDRDRILVCGPAVARLRFERAYVAMSHRPDRLVDVDESAPAPTIVAPAI